MLKFNVQNQTVTRTDNFSVVADSINYLTAEFSLSDEWTSPVTAVFGNNGVFYHVLTEDNKCIVPWEVIKAPFFTVSVFCGDLITANAVTVNVAKSGYAEGKETREPTPDVYTRLIQTSEETKQIAQSVREDADNGAFDGKDGYTPQRESDYWTDEDKAEIKAYVDEAILGGAW